MSPEELFKRLSKTDSYELLIWLKFLATKINCQECVKTRKKLSGKPPNCNECVPAAPLIKQNFTSLKKEKTNAQVEQINSFRSMDHPSRR